MSEEKELVSLPVNRSLKNSKDLPKEKMIEISSALADLMVICQRKYGMIPEYVYSIEGSPMRYFVTLDQIGLE